MDEKDYQMQKMARANLALLAELHAIKECVTCKHYAEKDEHCDLFLGYSCRDYDYEWRGVEEAEAWHEAQQNMKEAEARLKVLADAEECKYEGGYK